MKKHALFLGEEFNRNDKNLIQQVEQFYNQFDRQLQKAFTIPQTVQASGKAIK